MAGIGLERSVVDFLRERDAGFDDDIRAAEHLREASRAFGDRDAVADGESDSAAADELLGAAP